MTGELAIIDTVAQNVREARKAVGLSQEELALEANVDRTYISQVERGKRNITVVVLARLARALRTTTALLVSEAQESAGRAIRLHRYRELGALGGYVALFFLISRYERMWGDWDAIAFIF